MKRFQTSLLEILNPSASEGPPRPASTGIEEQFDERIFLRLKLYLEPYPEYRLMLGDTAPEPIRLLTISRNGPRPSRQFVVMIERRLFTKSNAEWVIPTLLRVVRAVAKEGITPAGLRAEDRWVDRLYRLIPQFFPSLEQPEATRNLPPPEPESPPDLRAVWKALVTEYFPEQQDLLTYRVVWSYRTQTMTLASCQAVKRVVRVASVMQRSEALPYLEALVYHELCHAALGPIRRVNGRRVIHGREFKALERRHPGIPALDRWIATGGWRALVRKDRRDKKRPSSR